MENLFTIGILPLNAKFRKCGLSPHLIDEIEGCLVKKLKDVDPLFFEDEITLPKDDFSNLLKQSIDESTPLIHELMLRSLGLWEEK